MCQTTLGRCKRRRKPTLLFQKYRSASTSKPSASIFTGLLREVKKLTHAHHLCNPRNSCPPDLIHCFSNLLRRLLRHRRGSTGSIGPLSSLVFQCACVLSKLHELLSCSLVVFWKRKVAFVSKDGGNEDDSRRVSIVSASLLRGSAGVRIGFTFRASRQNKKGLCRGGPVVSSGCRARGGRILSWTVTQRVRSH